MIALDIFIGLVLIYFLYALLVSIIAEAVSTWIGMRARMLRQGIDNLLNDKQTGQNNKYDFMSWLKDVFLVEPKEFKHSQAGRFYHEPTIKYMAKVGEPERWYSIRNTKPAYISKENFTHTVLNMLNQRSQGINEWDKVKFAIKHNAMALEPDTHKMFQDWVARSNDQYGIFITNIERTYEDMMDRVNGWYKRKIGLFLSVIGFGVCMVMNVDTIEIVKILAISPEKRKEMVDLAIKTIESQDKYIAEQSNKESIKRDDSLQLIKLQEQYSLTINGIKESKAIMAAGWNFPDSIYSKKNMANKKMLKVKHILWQGLPFWKLKFWGLLITALALGLGSQFWYDLLKKLIALRGAGVKPEERDVELKKELEIKKDGNNGMASITKDPVEIAISENRDYWESLPGFISVNLNYDRETKGNIVKLVFQKDKLAFDEKTIKVNNVDVLIKAVEGHKGSLVGTSEDDDALFPTGAVIQESTSAWGTPAGIFLDRRTNKKVLVTCGHVLRENQTVFFEKDKNFVSIQIDDKNRQKIGKVKNLVMSAFCDAGIVELDNEKILDNMENIFPIKSFRQVTSLDNQSTIVKINKLNSKVREGIIIRTKEYHTFDDGGLNARYFDLIIMSHKENKKIPISQKGDSGALISDLNGTPIGILIGGAEIDGNHYTYGIKIKDIIDILQLQTI